MITAGQVKDLKKGDVVRFRHEAWDDGVWIEGALHRMKGEPGSKALYIGGVLLKNSFGELAPGPARHAWLELVRKAPRRFYVNADRDSVVGDVATTSTSSSVFGPWFRTEKGWIGRYGDVIVGDMPAEGNVLLVDGETRKATNYPDRVASSTVAEEW